MGNSIRCNMFCLLEASCERNLDDLIESLGVSDTSAAVDTQPTAVTTQPAETEPSEKVHEKPSQVKDDAATEGEDMKELRPEESDRKAAEEEQDEDVEAVDDDDDDGDEELEHSELMPSVENLHEKNTEECASGLRRRNRPE